MKIYAPPKLQKYGAKLIDLRSEGGMETLKKIKDGSVGLLLIMEEDEYFDHLAADGSPSPEVIEQVRLFRKSNPEEVILIIIFQHGQLLEEAATTIH